MDNETVLTAERGVLLGARAVGPQPLWRVPPWPGGTPRGAVWLGQKLLKTSMLFLGLLRQNQTLNKTDILRLLKHHKHGSCPSCCRWRSAEFYWIVHGNIFLNSLSFDTVYTISQTMGLTTQINFFLHGIFCTNSIHTYIWQRGPGLLWELCSLGGHDILLVCESILLWACGFWDSYYLNWLLRQRQPVLLEGGSLAGSEDVEAQLHSIRPECNEHTSNGLTWSAKNEEQANA